MFSWHVWSFAKRPELPSIRQWGLPLPLLQRPSRIVASTVKSPVSLYSMLKQWYTGIQEPSSPPWFSLCTSQHQDFKNSLFAREWLLTLKPAYTNCFLHLLHKELVYRCVSTEWINAKSSAGNTLTKQDSAILAYSVTKIVIFFF